MTDTVQVNSHWGQAIVQSNTVDFTVNYYLFCKKSDFFLSLWNWMYRPKTSNVSLQANSSCVAFILLCVDKSIKYPLSELCLKIDKAELWNWHYWTILAEFNICILIRWGVAFLFCPCVIIIITALLWRKSSNTVYRINPRYISPHYFLISFRFLWHTLPALFLSSTLSVLSSLPSHARHEWRQTASLTAARMRQQLILGCPPSLLKGRYRVSNSSSWLDTMEISVQGQSSMQVN